MTMEIGRKIEHGLNQIVDTFMIAMMQRQERIQRENDYAQKLHQDIISKLENQFQNELQTRDLSVEYRGENFKFEKIDNGNLIFHSNDKKISIAANEIESSIKEKEPIHTKEQTNFNHPLDPSQNKTIETPILKTEIAPEVVSAKEIKIKSEQKIDDDTKENTEAKINFKDDKEQVKHMLNSMNSKEQELMVQYTKVLSERLDNHFADSSSDIHSNRFDEMKKNFTPEQINKVTAVVNQNIHSASYTTDKENGKIHVDKFDKILENIRNERTKENVKENNQEQTKGNTIENTNFKDDKEQIKHILNLLNGQEQKLMVQYTKVMNEGLDNHYADKSSYKESHKLDKMKEDFTPEQIEKVNTVVKQNISGFDEVDGKVSVDKIPSILKDIQQERTKENAKENIAEQTIEKNSEKNETIDPSQNKTIETPILKTENTLEVPADIRGKLEAINMLKNMSSKEITDTIKESQKISSNENKPFGEVYKDKLIEKFESSLTQSRKDLVMKSEQIFNESSVVKEKINDGLDKINAALVQLENSQKHGLIPEGKYNELKSSLVGDRDKLTSQLDKVVGAERKMENQLKYDLKSQFPDLKVAQLNAKQTLDIAKTACIATKRDLNSLKSFAKENKLENTMKAINKATKEVEVVVEKTVEVSINR
ncbi:hypothetical protein COE43_12690 [Bacillus cereus]|nr:hypothetical protein COE43_12690 [Bacillus cereus]